MKNRLFFKTFFLILIGSLWIACQNSPTDKKDDDSNQKTSIMNEDSIIVHSIIKNTNTDSMLFLNYPSFITEEIYNKLRQYNIKAGNLDSNGRYNAYIKDRQLNCDIFTRFENNKLLAIGLDYGFVSKDLCLDIKNIYDEKYGNYIMDTILTDNIVYNMVYKPKEKDKKFYYSYCYKYSIGNKIVELTLSPESEPQLKSSFASINHDCNISAEYYTLNSFNNLQVKNKTIEDSDKKLQKKKTDKTLKDL